MKLQIDFSQGGNDTLDRVIEAYGFRTKVALAEHLGIASSSLANRYKRDFSRQISWFAAWLRRALRLSGWLPGMGQSLTAKTSTF